MPRAVDLTIHNMRFGGGVGGGDSPLWLTRRRQVALTTLIVAVTATAAWLRYAVAWTPLQRQYLKAYLLSGMPILGPTDFDVLVLIEGKTSRWAIDDDVTIAETSGPNVSFAASVAVDHAAEARVEWHQEHVSADVMHGWLRRWIYGNQAVIELALPPFRAAFDAGLIFVIVFLSRDLARVQRTRIRPSDNPRDGTTPTSVRRPPAPANVRSTTFFQ